MSNTRDILQDCLEQLEAGKSAEEVLARYPEQRGELARLLFLSQGLQRSAPYISESAKARVRYQVQGAARVLPAPHKSPSWQSWLLRVAVSLVAVIILGGGTLVAAAESSPGEPFFPARAAFNETRARLVGDPRAAILIHLDNAEDRMQDVRVLKQRGRLSEAPIFLMVGETENLMTALENSPDRANRVTLERASKLVQSERVLLRSLAETGPTARPKRNAETLLGLSDSWEPLLNRLLTK
jgi:hypothetical protein